MSEYKSCGNCVNCHKVNDNLWCCEEYGFYHAGIPVHVEPPYDEACEMWTTDPKKANTWEKFV